MTLDAEKYADALVDPGSKQAAPLLVVAAVDALVRDAKLKWCLPQMWNDKDDAYATHWRVLGLTKRRLLVVAARSAATLWTRDHDDLDDPDHGRVIEAWTRPIVDVEALICDSPNVAAARRPEIDQDHQDVDSTPAYSIRLRGDIAPVPVSARLFPVPQDYEATARFVDLLLSRWP
jgi:hypothetical protein